MTKLIIDERDLRCTILQGMRELLKTSDLDHRVEEVIQQVLACGDPVGPSAPLTSGVLNRCDHPGCASIVGHAPPHIEYVSVPLHVVPELKIGANVAMIHTECKRMNGTGPCACLDGCGSCDSCGEWLGDDEQK